VDFFGQMVDQLPHTLHQPHCLYGKQGGEKKIIEFSIIFWSILLIWLFRVLSAESSRADSNRNYGFYIDGDIAKLPGKKNIFFIIMNVLESSLPDSRWRTQGSSSPLWTSSWATWGWQQWSCCSRSRPLQVNYLIIHEIIIFGHLLVNFRSPPLRRQRGGN